MERIITPPTSTVRRSARISHNVQKCHHNMCSCCCEQPQSSSNTKNSKKKKKYRRHQQQNSKQLKVVIFRKLQKKQVKYIQPKLNTRQTKSLNNKSSTMLALTGPDCTTTTTQVGSEESAALVPIQQNTQLKHFNPTLLGFIHQLITVKHRTDQSLEFIELNYSGNFRVEHPQWYMQLLVISFLEHCCVNVSNNNEILPVKKYFNGKKGTAAAIDEQPEETSEAGIQQPLILFELGRHLKKCIVEMEKKQQQQYKTTQNGRRGRGDRLRCLLSLKQQAERILLEQSNLALEMVWSSNLDTLMGHPLLQKRDQIARAVCDFLHDY